MTRRLLLGIAAVLLAGPVQALQPDAPEVAVAGVAFAGAGSDAAISERFPYSQRYIKALELGGAPIGAQLLARLQAAGPKKLQVIGQIESLQGRDQALAVALVIESESVVTEQFGELRKLLVLVRGQAMFFDFKSMNVVRAYPLSFAYVDVMDHAPSDDEKIARVKLVFEGANDKPGLLSRFVNSVANADIPPYVPKFIQVTQATISPDVLATLPGYVQSDPQTWLADMVGEAISTRVGVPIVPFNKGVAIGKVMSMRVSDGRVWELKLPQPDYEIKVNLKELKKIKFSEIENGATSFVYGAYAQFSIEDALQKKFLSTLLKNGETRVIPASQKYVDDFPNFYDAINGLLTKLALSIDGRGDGKWIKNAATAKDIGAQIAQTQELMKQCK